MTYRNKRFNARMLSIEQTIIDPAKDKNLSDDGLGVKRMMDALDYDDATETLAERTIQKACANKLLEAEMRLVDAGKRFLIPVLLLIVENVDNREESLKRVSKRTYFRHRNALLRFFSQPQP